MKAYEFILENDDEPAPLGATFTINGVVFKRLQSGWVQGDNEYLNGTDNCKLLDLRWYKDNATNTNTGQMAMTSPYGSNDSIQRSNDANYASKIVDPKPVKQWRYGGRPQSI